jgi:hypothetical protein
MLSAIADGFTLHPGMIEIPGRYEPMAIAQLELLRRSKTYRPYWVRVPEGSQTVGAFGSFQYQVHLKPGSWLYGLQLTVLDVLDQPVLSMNSAVLSIQITETYSGAQLFSEHSRTQPLCNQCWFGDTSRLQFFPLAEPKVIIDPGDLDIDVCNLTDLARKWELILFTAEPYELVEA